MTQSDPELTPTYQERTLGERSAIRRFDPQNISDVTALLLICQSESNQKWLEGLPKDEAEVRDWITHPGKNSFLFAISGSSTHVDLGQVGEVQGFIYIYPTGIDTANQLSDQKLLTAQEFNQAIVREVSYGLRPNALPLQVASALRQAITQDEGNVVADEKFPPQDLIYFAFTSPTNTNSERVLTASGFTNIGQSKYEDEANLDNVWRLIPTKLDQIKLKRALQNKDKDF